MSLGFKRLSMHGAVPPHFTTWCLFKHRDTFNFTIRVKRTFVTSLDFHFPQGYQLSLFICTHPAYQWVFCLASVPCWNTPWWFLRNVCNILILVICVYKREVTSHVGGMFSCTQKNFETRLFAPSCLSVRMWLRMEQLGSYWTKFL